MISRWILRLIPLALVLISAPAIAQRGGKAEPLKIEFKRGTHSTTISESVRGDEEAEYTFTARKDQRLTIHLISTPRRSAVFDLHGPDDVNLGLEYDANYDYTGTLPADGDYFLNVTRLNKSKRKSSYKLTVTIR